jgi:hypothetical protein
MPFPVITTLAPRAIHGREETRSRDPRSEDGEVEQIGMSKI